MMESILSICSRLIQRVKKPSSITGSMEILQCEELQSNYTIYDILTEYTDPFFSSTFTKSILGNYCLSCDTSIGKIHLLIDFLEHYNKYAILFNKNNTFYIVISSNSYTTLSISYNKLTQICRVYSNNKITRKYTKVYPLNLGGNIPFWKCKVKNEFPQTELFSIAYCADSEYFDKDGNIRFHDIRKYFFYSIIGDILFYSYNGKNYYHINLNSSPVNYEREIIQDPAIIEQLSVIVWRNVIRYYALFSD